MMSRKTRTNISIGLIVAGVVCCGYQLMLDTGTPQPRKLTVAEKQAIAYLPAPEEALPIQASVAPLQKKKPVAKPKKRKVASLVAKKRVVKHKNKNGKTTAFYKGKRLMGSVTVHSPRKRAR